MQAGPDSLAETKTAGKAYVKVKSKADQARSKVASPAGKARKDSSFRGCDGCWHGDRCLAHGDYGAD